MADIPIKLSANVSLRGGRKGCDSGNSRGTRLSAGSVSSPGTHRTGAFACVPPESPGGPGACGVVVQEWGEVPLGLRPTLWPSVFFIFITCTEKCTSNRTTQSFSQSEHTWVAGTKSKKPASWKDPSCPWGHAQPLPHPTPPRGGRHPKFSSLSDGFDLNWKKRTLPNCDSLSTVCHAGVLSAARETALPFLHLHGPQGILDSSGRAVGARSGPVLHESPGEDADLPFALPFQPVVVHCGRGEQRPMSGIRAGRGASSGRPHGSWVSPPPPLCQWRGRWPTVTGAQRVCGTRLAPS